MMDISPWSTITAEDILLAPAFRRHLVDTNLFHYILQPKIERSTTLPPIKTPDGARPDGVHDKGTVLFYKIYKDIGFDSMKKVIRCFTDLENKNTYEYLNALRKNGFSHVADVIKENLEK